MQITVLGSGMVGRQLAARFIEIGHDVAIGTREPGETIARDAGDDSFARWWESHPSVQLLPFAEAGAFGEVVVNVTHGAASLSALESVGAEHLAGKVVWDIGLPLDFSAGMPPTLTVANNDSLGEQIQRAFPAARVVKALNTVYVAVMIDPARVPGDHSVFVAGDDQAAKDTVTAILREIGWAETSVFDLGGIKGARAAEMYSRLFFDLYAALGTFDFNIAVVRG